MKKEMREVPLWYVEQNEPKVYARAVKNIEARGVDVDDRLTLNYFSACHGFEWTEAKEGGIYWMNNNNILKKKYNDSIVAVDNYSII